tara:strand:- start:2233 stop:2463 length:231 start_codon:yes stop_codon:yes gene_type:complete
MTHFVLIGTIMSFDSFLATVEFQTNPPVNGGASLAVMPVQAIPCEVEVGKKVYVVKYEKQEIPTITCEREKDNEDI